MILQSKKILDTKFLSSKRKHTITNSYTKHTSRRHFWQEGRFGRNDMEAKSATKQQQKAATTLGPRSWSKLPCGQVALSREETT